MKEVTDAMEKEKVVLLVTKDILVLGEPVALQMVTE